MPQKNTSNIVIFHHHLQPGGVSRIIQSQIRCLQSYSHHYSICILIGNDFIPEWLRKAQKKGNLNIRHDENLSYLNPNIKNSVILKKRYDAILECFTKTMRQQDILHVHNTNLGKNPLVTLAVHQLENQGYRIVKHCHDFCEDGRLTLFKHLKRIVCNLFKQSLDEVLYSALPNVRYITINGRDKKIIEDAGVPSSNITYLPNPILLPLASTQKTQKPFSDDKRIAHFNTYFQQKFGKQLQAKKYFYLYPVRAIARKNIGEVILLATLFQNEALFAITLAPKNPIELKIYHQWLLFCRKNNIPVYFDMGNQYDFNVLTALADKIITTSVCEGFGMTYLEPVLYEKEIFGRDLANITGDMKQNNIAFPHLYSHLWIPISKKMFQSIKRRYQNLYVKICRNFSLALTKAERHRWIKAKLIDYTNDSTNPSQIKEPIIDFANLTVNAQQDIIKRTLNNASYRQNIRQLNPKLIQLKQFTAKPIVKSNLNIVKKKYSEKCFHTTLLSLYTKLSHQKTPPTFTEKSSHATPQKPLQKQIKTFITPQNVHLIRWQ